MKRKITGILFGCVMMQGVLASEIDIKGRVLETGTREAVEAAHVVLQTADSVFVAGTVTDLAGEFIFSRVETADYRIVISSVGYRTLYREVAGAKGNVQLGELLLEEEVVGLEAVTVTASSVLNRIDRKLVFPTEKQINASSNGIDLLQQMMLPRLQVNPLTREVSLPGGGNVQLRINGVKAETDEVVALLPADVIRIEYHDNPGLRYGNAEVVLDFIVRRHETGGSMSFDSRQSPKLSLFGNNSISGKVNHKRSEFSAGYSLSHRNITQGWRDNEETFRFEDGSVLQRKEAGEPGDMSYNRANARLGYSYLEERRMINATLRYFSNAPTMKYKGQLYNMASPEDYVQMLDRTTERSARPALDLYWQENLKNNRTLVVNLVGTDNRSDNSRVYTESRGNELLTDIDNVVTGNKYSWIGEGIYERKLGANRLSAGLRHTQSYSDNTYANGHAYRTEMQQGETYLYGEWKGRIRKLDYTLGAGVTRSSFRQEAENVDYSTYTFNPRMAFYLPLPRSMSLRLTGNIRNNTPSLSNLSAVEMAIDSLQVQRGNPNLKPHPVYRTELTWEWQKSIFQASLRGTYENKPSAIMEEKFWEGDRIVQTWNNQKRWEWASVVTNLRLGPVKDILTVSVNGGLNHFVSRGNSYYHVYNNPFCNVTLNGNYKNFNAMFIWQKSWNHFEGETMTGGENIHVLMADYKYKNIKAGVAIMCPFSNNYYRDTENRSAYASYKKRDYINDSSRMLLVTFAWNFTFGRSYQSGRKRLDNSDDDAGVMKAGK